MSYNGSGTFVINSAGQPVVSGTVISSTAFNALTADLATGLSTAITKDGQTTITANIPMANYKFTGLGVGSAAGDSANLSQVQSTAVKLLASVSGADTITAVGSPNVAAYVAGQMFYFVAAAANTGAVTINIDSLGAKSITRDGTTALAAGDIQSGEVCVIVYDGTQFQLVNGASQSAAIVTNSLTVNGTSSLDGAVTINDSGADVDFRIESDTDANAFFLDGATGAIGVGVTPSAWDANSYAIQLGNRASLRGGSDLTVLANNYYDSSSGGIYLASAAASDYYQSAGSHIWRTAASGTAGDPVSLTTTMTLNASGSLGLGVTPSAWFSGIKGFQIGLSGALAANTAVTQVRLMNNAYYDSAGNSKYLGDGYAQEYTLNNSGQHTWSYAANNTSGAGASLTFTQAMTLFASGGLNIGATSDPGAGNVNISGTSTMSQLAVTAAGVANMTIGFNASGGTVQGIVNNAAYVSVRQSYPLVFGTAETERARITSGGYLKASDDGTYNNATGAYHEIVQTANAETILIIGENASLTGNLCNVVANRNTTNNSFYAINYYNNGAGANKFRVADSGDVTNTNNSYGAISDEKMKQDIVDASSQWDDIKGLRVRKFRYKADPTAPLQIGLVAQEAEVVSPGLVDEHPDYEEVEVTDEEGNVTTERQPTGTSTKSVKYSVLYMKAVKALQEAMTRIEELEAKVAALEAK